MNRILFQAVDIFGNLIELTEERWKTHILTGHYEVELYIEQIKETIKSPDCIFESRYEPDTRLFYKRGITQGKYRNLYMKVVVSYSETPAFIKTAFFTPQLTGGKLLWIKTTL
ncbi:MAG: hypothetical protein ACE5PV_06425 [Candidatus Poribacteria bacterium]